MAGLAEIALAGGQTQAQLLLDAGRAQAEGRLGAANAWAQGLGTIAKSVGALPEDLDRAKTAQLAHQKAAAALADTQAIDDAMQASTRFPGAPGAQSAAIPSADPNRLVRVPGAPPPPTLGQIAATTPPDTQEVPLSDESGDKAPAMAPPQAPPPGAPSGPASAAAPRGLDAVTPTSLVSVDYDKAIQLLAAQGHGAAAEALEQRVSAMRTAQAVQTKDNLTSQGLAFTQLGDDANAMLQLPAGDPTLAPRFQAFKQKVAQYLGGQYADALGTPADEASLRQTLTGAQTWGMTQKDTIDAQRAAVQLHLDAITGAHTAAETNDLNRKAVATMFATASDNTHWQVIRLSALSQGIPQSMLDEFGAQWSPQNQATAKTQAIGVDEQAKLDQENTAEQQRVAAAAETARHNAATEATSRMTATASQTRAATGATTAAIASGKADNPTFPLAVKRYLATFPTRYTGPSARADADAELNQAIPALLQAHPGLDLGKVEGWMDSLLGKRTGDPGGGIGTGGEEASSTPGPAYVDPRTAPAGPSAAPPPSPPPPSGLGLPDATTTAPRPIPRVAAPQVPNPTVPKGGFDTSQPAQLQLVRQRAAYLLAQQGVAATPQNVATVIANPKNKDVLGIR